MVAGGAIRLAQHHRGGPRLVAAGRSRRFGADKRLAPLADGTPLIVAGLQPVLALGLDLTVVVRAHDDAVVALLRDCGIDPDAIVPGGEGLGDSVAAGVAASGEPVRGYLLQLADLPWIDPATWRRLADAVTPGRIVRPYWRGQPGHPVGFGVQFRDELIALRGSDGARSIIDAHADALDAIETDDSGVVRDIDTADDLAPPQS